MPGHMDYLLTRRTVPSAFLEGPVPDEAQIEQILTASCRVPDHKKLEPWRVIRFDEAGCSKMNDLISERFIHLTPDATDAMIDVEKTRFSRAPMVMAVISSPKDNPKVPLWEQQLSAGAVCMNMIHACYAAGFSAQWLTEWYAFDDVILDRLGLRDGEQVAGFIHIGTPTIEPADRPRPDISDIVSVWQA